MAKRTYTTDRIAVHWDSQRCIHTGMCLRSLPEVFDTSNRPWVTVDGADADAVAAAIEKCPSGALRYERLDGAAGEMASLMTLHAAKGLEFDNVFLPGWEEEVFPNRRSIDDGGSAALEEERRLAYVGLTRARRRVWICHASSRRVYNQWLACAPSRFIDELPDELVEHVVEAGLYGGIQEPGIAMTDAGWGNNRPGRGPGYQRMRAAGAGRATPEPATELMASSGNITAGIRIFHQKFGYGIVKSNEGGKLEIDFEKAGIKKVMESFVEPA